MSKIAKSFWGGLAGLSVLWLLVNPDVLAGQPNFIAWRNVLVQYSGVLGMGVMSVAMLLAMRPLWLEPKLGGLDKLYRLHKWLGIAGLILSVSHWLLAKGPKWLSQLGLLQGGRPRGPRPAALNDGSLQALFQQLRHTAESMGEWAFYAAAALMVLALIKAVPYRWFSKLHRALPVAYLVLAFHSVVLLRFDNWLSPLGVVMTLLLAGGTVSAILSLLGKHAGRPAAMASISALNYQQSQQVLTVELQFEGNWPGHRAGQFAFITFDEKEGAHPFTLASAWRGDGKARVMIKALGDYTASLPALLKLGDAVKVEGPYGRFTFEGKTRRQIWISGGIGVTPFLARMQALVAGDKPHRVDFFHAMRDADESVIARLHKTAAGAGVKLHLFSQAQGQRLDAAQLQQLAPDWREADFWFCGPAGFGQQLKQALVAQGLPADRFHQELFMMR